MFKNILLNSSLVWDSFSAYSSTLTANPVMFLLPFKLQLNFCMDTIILFLGAFLLLILRKRFTLFHTGLPFMMAIWTLIFALLFTLDNKGTLTHLANETNNTSISIFWESFIISKSILKMKSWLYIGNILILSFLYNSFRQTSEKSDLYWTIPLVTTLLSCIGSLVLIAANLLTLLLCIETFSFLGLYVIRLTSNKMSAEASLLYFFMSLLSTGFLSLGFLLVYLGTGSYFLTDITDVLLSFYCNAEQLKINSNIIIGFGLIFGTFLFKLAAFPCFFWAPLTFKAMSLSGIALTSLTIKYVNACLFIKLCILLLPNFISITSNAFWVLLCAFGSIVVGTFLALKEFNFRKFLAFTSVNQMGYILLGLLPLAHSVKSGGDSVAYFVFIYFVSSLLFLSSVSTIRLNGLQLNTLSDLRILYHSNPFSAWMCLLAIFTMAGLPPTTGFWAKYYIIRNCWDASLSVTWDSYFVNLFQITLVLIVFLNFFSAIYYIRLVIMLIFNSVAINWVSFQWVGLRLKSVLSRFWLECKNAKLPEFSRGLKYVFEVRLSTISAFLKETTYADLDMEMLTRVGQVACALYIILDFLIRLG